MFTITLARLLFEAALFVEIKKSGNREIGKMHKIGATKAG